MHKSGYTLIAAVVGLTACSSATKIGQRAAATTTSSSNLFTTQLPAGSIDSTTSYELGMQFSADTNGSITDLRFYKTADNTGPHVGHLWSSGGTLLATVAFSGETATGWQDAALSTPVNIVAGSTYVVSYSTSTGFAFDQSFFDSPLDNPPLHAPIGAGVYAGAGGFPNQNYGDSNYWVDVTFSPVTVSNPGFFDSSATPTTTQYSSSTDYELGTQFTSDTDGTITHIRFYADAANNGAHSGHIWDSGGHVLGSVLFPAVTTTGWQDAALTTPVNITAGNQYTVSYRTATGFALDENYFAAPLDRAPLHVPVGGGVYGDGGTRPTNVFSNSNYWVDITFAATVSSNPGFFDSSATPTTTEYSSSTDYELGTQFSSDTDGAITHIRFYADATNNGSHTGRIWDSAGNLLGSVVFPAVTTTGWQDAALTTPVNITAGNQYTVSYRTATGFALDENYFAAPLDRAPLHVPVGGGVYGDGGTRPTNVFSNSNYWVDITFAATVSSNPGFFDATATPTTEMSSSTDYELGTQFTSDTDGAITHIRFYADATNNGSHTGRIWDSTGNLLGSVVFPAVTTTGWQDAALATPVNIAAGNQYTVSYETATGFAFDANYFATPLDRAPLHVPVGGGVYGGGGTLPTNNYSNSNYWVDIVFASQGSCNPVCSGVACGQPDGCGGVCSAASSTCTPVSCGTCQVANADGTACDIASDNTSCVDGLGNPGYCEIGACSNQGPFSTVFGGMGAPSSGFILSSTAYELGMQFTVDAGQRVFGVRVYESAGDTGTHVVSLWDSTGNLLQQLGPYAASGVTGWRPLYFTAAVDIVPGATYVVSYSTSSGYYADPAGFSSAKDVSPLHAPIGAGIYAAAGSYPTANYSNSNYWVDVMTQAGP